MCVWLRSDNLNFICCDSCRMPCGTISLRSDCCFLRAMAVLPMSGLRGTGGCCSAWHRMWIWIGLRWCSAYESGADGESGKGNGRAGCDVSGSDGRKAEAVDEGGYGDGFAAGGED